MTRGKPHSSNDHTRPSSLAVDAISRTAPVQAPARSDRLAVASARGGSPEPPNAPASSQEGGEHHRHANQVEPSGRVDPGDNEASHKDGTAGGEHEGRPSAPPSACRESLGGPPQQRGPDDHSGFHVRDDPVHDSSSCSIRGTSARFESIGGISFSPPLPPAAAPERASRPGPRGRDA